MSEDNSIMLATGATSLQKKVNKLFATKTPRQFIKSRPGPAGAVLKYVEVGYVVNTLNDVFGPFWEFRIVDKSIGKKQIWVQGQLTVKDPKTGFTITKENFGGVDIKMSRQTGEPVSVSKDLKASAGDCLKKCASMFGVAADVYFKEQDLYDALDSDIDEEDTSESVKKIVTDKYFAVAGQRGFHGEEAKELIKQYYNVAHMGDLSVAQLETAVKGLEAKYEVVNSGELPRKKGEKLSVVGTKDDPVYQAMQSDDDKLYEESAEIFNQPMTEVVDVDEMDKAIPV